MSNQEKHFYEFGPFRLDPVKRRLLRDGEPIPLTPKAFDTLLALVRQSGETVEKDDLMKMIWPDAVVEENNLNQNITALRRSLGDSRHESRYIATISGLGYRFVAEVKKAPFGEVELTVDGRGQSRLIVEKRGERGEDAQVEKPDLTAISYENSHENAMPVAATAQKVDTSERIESLLPPAPPSGESIIASLKRHRKVAALVLPLIVIGAAGIAIWVYEIVGRNRTETPAKEIEVTPLTRTGTTRNAAISPDGRHIVYSVREAGRESLWLRQVAASSAQQIVPPAEIVYQGLTFSRDGNHIHFFRTEMNGSVRVLYRMPALGGVATRLLNDIDSPVTLSPDGSRMAFVRNSGDESEMIIADADGSNQRKLATRPMTDYFKIPAWSPDGKEIACSTGSGEPYDIHNSIIAVRVEDGTQRPVTQKKWAWTRWVEWLADGSGLLITARERHGTPDQIWHISYPGGTARRLTSDSKFYFSICLTADSRTMLAVQTELLSDIWVMPDRDAEQARKITFGTGSYDSVCYAPDGRIVYSSQASGNWDIWIMNADGSSQKQLTADAGVNLHQTVSPDGQYIVFASNRAGVFNIWRINSDGGNPVQLTRGSGEKFPHCSPDGKWIVYNSVASDQSLYAMWKMPIEGGEPVQLTDSNTDLPAISPDGNRIAYFSRGESPNGQYKIGIIPFAGGRPDRTIDITQGLDPVHFVRWFPDGQSLTYAAARNGVFNIWMQPLSGGDAKQLTDFKAEGSLQFDWSRDGKQLVFSRRVWTSDLVLLRNFAPGKT
jgi:Tol biopolymer transport system component/DNA-binding winged helix-turn-helix (wHTH) protein